MNHASLIIILQNDTFNKNTRKLNRDIEKNSSTNRQNKFSTNSMSCRDIRLLIAQQVAQIQRSKQKTILNNA